MRIAVTGREGQVARALAERGTTAGHTILLLQRPAFDLAVCSTNAMRDQLAALSPDAVISAAAYTAVDRAETEPDMAYAVNARGAGALAEATADLGLPLVHLSTDYVFPGDRLAPYSEDDPTGPQGVYGASKLAGEEAVLAANPGAVVLRTAWVISPFGMNFVRTMLRLAATREEIGVVADQHGNPTSAFDLADAVLAVTANCLEDSDLALRGIFHAAGSGSANWADLAKAVFAESVARGGPVAAVRPITTAEYPTPARRPANSMLDCSRLFRLHGVALPSWQTSLAPIIARLLETQGHEA